MEWRSPMKVFSDLTDGQLDAGRAALAAHLGDEQAGKPSWLRRLALVNEGEWLLSYREAVCLDLGWHHDSPWSYPETKPTASPRSSEVRAEMQGMAFALKYGPIATVVALLQSAKNNPELEVDRRFRVFGDAVERDRQRGAREAQDENDRKRRIADHRARRPERWAALPREVKALYVAADGEHQTVSEALVAVAEIIRAGDGRLIAVARSFEPSEGR
jgi:hypothetical protein